MSFKFPVIFYNIYDATIYLFLKSNTRKKLYIRLCYLSNFIILSPFVRLNYYNKVQKILSNW